MSPKEDGIPTEIPQPWKKWNEDCRQQHHRKGWKYNVWNERNMRDYIAHKIPEILDVYDSYPSWIQRCDVFRYVIYTIWVVYTWIWIPNAMNH